MLAPSDLGWDLALYAQEWLEERFRLTQNLAASVAKSPKPSAVHDIRVACRRLREAIAFFHGVSEVPPLAEVDRAARQMARAVARLRETDVAIKQLAALEGALKRGGSGSPSVLGTSADALSAQKNLATRLRKRRKEIVEKRQERIERRAHKLDAAISHHLPLRIGPRQVDADPSKETHLKAFLDTRVDFRHHEVVRLFDAALRRTRGSAVSASDEELHAIRVAIKHWRYAVEIARAVTPRVLYRPAATRLRHLQELGGKSQDFADLMKVVEKDQRRHKKVSRGERSLQGAVKKERVRAAQAFAEGLRLLLPPKRNAPTLAVVQNG